ncbi:Cof-type HAD-IIB family hydrolase [Anaerosacchariphilus polymeriproducens]|uniref:Hydrolase n=1 Tax=Anaerosacchariphilus polymeriproducens TaxID=1812858 RepID=A0A371ARJ6_9FIRM|nr:hypothetical protein [Anaerosacchariphilus polymeriproducens]RDU22193.1 hypothetical protein DWV06_16840 [Anaerosacchariphilus polymeriproducens]
MNRNIYAVDFDGTLCFSSWPELGEPNEELIEFLKEEKKKGAAVILWTCRVKELLKAAVEWCERWGLTFDAVNENLPEVLETFGGDSRKIFATAYIDDKNRSLYELKLEREIK